MDSFRNQTFSIRKSESFPIEYAASIMHDFIQNVDVGLLKHYKIDFGGLLRLEIECLGFVHAENGPSMCTALLANIIHNRNLLPSAARCLYVSRNAKFGVLGYGCCMHFSSLADASVIIPKLPPHTQVIGGDLFEGDRTSSSSLGCSGWMIPIIEISFKANDDDSIVSLSLAAHLCTPDNESKADCFMKELHNLKLLLSSLSWNFQHPRSYLLALPPMKSNSFDTNISESEYDEVIRETLANIDDGKLAKVVYAVKRTGTCVTDIDAASLLLAVSIGNVADIRRRYTFLFAPNGLQQEVFISLSPERLCKADGYQITTEALAGTYPRAYIESGGDIDDKISREHSTVTDFIKSKLADLGGEVRVQRRELLYLQDLVHVRQIVSCQVSDAQANETKPLSGVALVVWAVQNLHPTPAVCGVPSEAALRSIQTREKLRRGLYSSNCGVLYQTGGELLVGLRSAVVQNNEVSVFAGAGIVRGSVAKDEWQEISLKMSQYTRILTSTRRPALSGEFINATAAIAALVVEEMLRSGVGAFAVCPGSRSTPFAVAIYRNTAARALTQVIHDERAAAFYALGCARAGTVCCVLVTSGTAVANLLPATAEADVSGLPLVLLTTDRAWESVDVGEAQTIRQSGLFSSFVSWSRDFPPLATESPTLTGQLVGAVLADMSFAIGEIATRRRQRVHLNFQIRKPEIDPEVIDDMFCTKFQGSLTWKSRQWLREIQPYCRHMSAKEFFSSPHTSVLLDSLSKWFSSDGRMWSVLIVAGDLISVCDSQMVRWFSSKFQLPCVCDVLSNIAASGTENETCFLGVDRLLQAPMFAEALATSVRTVLRIGSSIISARLQEWLSTLTMATVVRVRDDGSDTCRHDPTWTTSVYVHANICDFFTSLVKFVPVTRMDNKAGCCALRTLKLAAEVQKQLVRGISLEVSFTEPQVAVTIQEESPPGGSFFLSSSMPCREFDGFPVSSSAEYSQGIRLVGCNRGANGIDGVISTACGFASINAADDKPLTLLIGDIATLHDISGISIAAGASPGSVKLLNGGRVDKIVCVNNSGGAIFSFLPAAKFREDFFTPFLDTPHDLNLADIARGLTGNSSMTCVRVSSVEELRTALRFRGSSFIECAGLPSHAENVLIHKKLTESVVDDIHRQLVNNVFDQLSWTLHTREGAGPASPGTGAPLLVLLHGWLGSPSDWTPLIHHMRKSFNIEAMSVSTGIDLLCPSLFCCALRKLLLERIRRPLSSTSSGGSNGKFSLVLMGYSQGGRLCMHYRSMFPDDVMSLVTLSSAPGRVASVDFERTVVDHWLESEKSVEAFLLWWYGLPVFSNMSRRLPDMFHSLVERRIQDRLPIGKWLRNMICTATTNDTTVDLAVVGSLDTKYVSLCEDGQRTAKVHEVRVIPNCGHAVLVEADAGIVADACLHTILAAMSPSVSLLVHSPVSIPIKTIIDSIFLTPFEHPLQTPLEVLSGNQLRSFSARRGVRITIKVGAITMDGKSTLQVGVGECYEPVFETTSLNYHTLIDGATTAAASLRGASLIIPPACTPADAASIVRAALAPLKDRVNAAALFGFEQSLLHCIARWSQLSLVDCIAAYLGRPLRHSHVRSNGFIPRVAVTDGDPPPPNEVGKPRVTKMKVGDVMGTQAAADAVRVNEYVHARTRGSHFKDWLRLDANQSWSPAQASEFAASLSDAALAAIQYVEEPLRSDAASSPTTAYNSLLELSEAWRSLRIALDESLVQRPVQEVDGLLVFLHKHSGGGKGGQGPSHRRVIVKPALLGIDCAYLKLSAGSDYQAEEVTISCTFESSLGLAFLVCIAACFPGVHGIHPHPSMAQTDGRCTAYADTLALLNLNDEGASVAAAEGLLDEIADDIC